MSERSAPAAPDLAVAYLARVRAGLRLPETNAADVIEELAGHLADATEALREEGMTQDQARQEAIARLGSPDALADEIRRAHQTTRRALAAVGGGVVSAVSSGFYGLVLGFATAMLGLVAVSGVVWVAGDVVEGMRSESLATAGTTLGAWVWGLAAYFAAGAATRRIATVSHRAIGDVRVPLAVLFGTAVAVVLAVQPVYLDSVAVVAIAFVPFAAVAGTLRATEFDARRPSRRGRAANWAVVIAGAVVVLVIAIYAPGTTSVGGELGEPLTVQEYREVYGPRYAAMGAIIDNGSAVMGAFYGEANEATVDAHLGPDVARWSDVRFEVWLRDAASDAVPEGVDRALAAAPIAPTGPSHAAIDIGRLRDVGPYFAVVTGTSPRGDRVILNGPVRREAVFRGTVVEWLLAPSARP